MVSIARNVVTAEACHDWPLGSKVWRCDKSGRGDVDDPCSECRWFGGENCRCMLAKDTSYNDQIWSIMMRRGQDQNYTLPPAKDRDDFNEKKAVAPAPMPANKVKAGWQGETKEALLAKPDMLPPGVRDCPRAFLRPPRPSSAMKKKESWENSKKRKRESDTDVDARIAPSTTGSAFTIFPPRPPAHPQYGEVVTATWSSLENRWTYTYASGVEIRSPPMPAPTHH